MTTSSNRFGGVWLLAGVAVAALSIGCAKKPPGCGDTETVQDIRSMLIDNAKAQAFNPTAGPGALEDDPGKIQERYYQGLKVEMSNVVSDGYNEQAKANSCRGTLSFTTITGEALSQNIAYRTQRTEDKDKDFIVQIRTLDALILAVASDAFGNYAQKRYGGDWKGTYSCGGIDGAKDGPQGPFSMPVTMVVADGVSKLERTTKGGGVEVLNGKSGHVIKLGGEGKNSPDDTWQTYFEGTVKGMDFDAEGEIFTSDKRVLRSCTLKLKLPSN